MKFEEAFKAMRKKKHITRMEFAENYWDIPHWWIEGDDIKGGYWGEDGWVDCELQGCDMLKDDWIIWDNEKCRINYELER